MIVLSSPGDFAPVTRHFFAPSLYILYAAYFNYYIGVQMRIARRYMALFTERTT